MKIKLSLILVCFLLLIGCQPPKPDDPVYAPVMPESSEHYIKSAGSLYHESLAVSLFEDIKARHVGDIITVVLSESTNANVKFDTGLTRDTSVDLQNPTLLGAQPEFNTPGDLPLSNNKNNTLEIKAEGKSSFSGKGESKQNNALTGKIAVTVVQVLPNGNLVVRGEKWLNLNRGREFIRLTGMIRPADIDGDNIITSAKVANARITYSGVGTVANHSRPGWLLKGVTSIIWPF